MFKLRFVNSVVSLMREIYISKHSVGIVWVVYEDVIKKIINSVRSKQ